MDGYDQAMKDHLNLRGTGDFLYGVGGSGDKHHPFGHLGFPDFHELQLHQQQVTALKTESGTWQHDHAPKFHYHAAYDHRRLPGEDPGETMESMKSKITAHPQYSNLVEAYINCHKIGAPPEMVNRLFHQPPRPTSGASIYDSNDPELDRFMETYCNMLVKLREELTTPLKESMEFIQSIETQLNQLTPRTDGSSGVGCSSDVDQGNRGDAEEQTGIDPRANDPQLKSYLRSKYRGYFGTLKQEFCKKKKKCKLPKEARHKLLTWWQLHYKWPYPSESEKVALGESTGLDPKQINNWFINQRKRHWKPSDEGEFMVMDGSHNAPLYMDGHYLGHHGRYTLGP